jgi:hypothetical protein
MASEFEFSEIVSLLLLIKSSVAGILEGRGEVRYEWIEYCTKTQ